MDIKKAHIKVFSTKDTIFGRTDSSRSRAIVGGLANYNKSFLDLVEKSLEVLNISGTIEIITEATELPTFNSNTYPKGTIIQGDTIGSFISNGENWFPLSSATSEIPVVDSNNNGLMISTDKVKLDGIESNADVTNSTNVDSAGAVMESDDSTSNMSFVIDEDDFSSDSDTKIPTQQSVKAYVDASTSSTNLDTEETATNIVVTSDTGTDATIPLANASTAGLISPTEKTKLSGIEDLADVTDSTNVKAAGAVMNSDTTTASMSFVVDEDDMLSDSPIKIPTQQSVKAFVESTVSNIPTPDGKLGLNYLKEYWVKSFTGVENMPVSAGMFAGYNTRSYSKTYKGKHHRTYMMHQAIESNKRVAKVYWYDFETEDFSSQVYQMGDPALTNDSHNGFTLNIDPDGYIMIVSNLDDGVIKIYKSNYPELDNNGVVDATYTLMTNSTSISSYTNYASSAYMSDRLVIDWRGTISGSATQEDRAIAWSDDHGVTYSKRNWLSLDNGHWAYGTIHPDKHRGGVFLTVAIREDSNSGYPKWGVVWTKDLVNFGDMEYYASNGESGWSKDVVTNGVITDIEFVANLAVINDNYDENNNHYLPYLSQSGFGHVVIQSLDGTRSGSVVVTDYVTSIYNVYDKAWVHNYVPIGDFPIVLSGSSVNRASIVPYDENNMWLVVKNKAADVDLLYTTDGGVSWILEKEGLNTNTCNVIVSDNFTHSDKQAFVFIQSADTAIEVVRFGENKTNSTYNELKGGDKSSTGYKEYIATFEQTGTSDISTVNIIKNNTEATLTFSRSSIGSYRVTDSGLNNLFVQGDYYVNIQLGLYTSTVSNKVISIEHIDSNTIDILCHLSDGTLEDIANTAVNRNYIEIKFKD